MNTAAPAHGDKDMVLDADVTAHGHGWIVPKEGVSGGGEGGIRGRLSGPRNTNYGPMAAAGRNNRKERLAVAHVITGFCKSTKKLKADAIMKAVMESPKMNGTALQELYAYPAYTKAFGAAMWRLINIKINKQEVRILMADLTSL